MHKYMAQYNTGRYIDYLPEITRTFNIRVNRTIGMCPNNSYQPRNKSVVLYILELLYNKTFKRRRLPTFTVNDRVRIFRLSRNKELSKKIYNTKFTEEIFTIIRINTRLPKPRYYIKDSNGDNIDGAFQEYELSKVM